MPTKNYCFGAAAPLTNLQSVNDQMFAAHRYRNKLVELELARRTASEEAIRRLHPEYAEKAAAVDAAEARIEAAFDAVKKARQKARSRLEATDEQKAEIVAAKAEAKTAYHAAKAAKTEAYRRLKELQEPLWVEAKEAVASRDDASELKEATRKRYEKAEFLRLAEAAELDAGAAAYKRNSKAARANCGCHWGTYLIVEEAAKEFGTGAPPRFKRWEHDGTIAVQLMGGLSVANALSGEDTRLRIHLKNEEELAVKGRSRGKRSEGIVQLRIGTHEDGRTPIWTEIPVRFHRPLPRQGDIRWAYLHRERVATHFEWKLRLTISEEVTAENTQATVAVPGSLVAVHPGWRMRPDGSLRVCTWIGSDGRGGETLLDEDWLRSDAALEHLASIRDIHLNGMLRTLGQWLADHEAILPEWLREDVKTISQWRSPARLAALVLRWREQRFTGDEDLWVAPPDELDSRSRHEWHKEHAGKLLESWRKQDKHLYEWQENQRLRLIRRRKDLYRCEAKRLAAQYESVAIAKINWADMLSKEGTLQDVQQTDRQRHYGRMASPGELIQCVKEAFGNRVILVAEHDITGACYVCGHKDDWDRKRNLSHTCSQCGTTWDQDHNACQNQLARAEVSRTAQESLATDAAQRDTPENDTGDAGVLQSKKGGARKSRRNRRASPLLR